jgi:hypothetical protein
MISAYWFVRSAPVFLFITVGSAILFAAEKTPAVVLLDLGSTHYVFEEAVNIRQEPDENSERTGKAELGDKVFILDNSSSYEELYGIIANWYRVQVGSLEGWMWGGLISTSEAVADFDGDGSQELLLCLSYSKFNNHNDPNFYGMAGYTYRHRYKFVDDGRVVSEKPFKQTPLVFNRHIECLVDDGFDPRVPVVWLLEIDGSEAFMPASGEFWYYTGKLFEKISGYTDVFESDYSKTHRLLFPSENNQQNLLILQTVIDQHNSASGGDPTTDLMEASWQWDGKRFLENR